MTMVDETVLRRAFRTQLKTVDTLPGDSRLAWQNRAFRPPGVPTAAGPLPLWVEEQLRILTETKSSTGFIEAVGEALYSVFTPIGKGTEEADALVKAIAEALQSGQSITKSGLYIILEHTERSPFRQDPEYPAWLFKTVTARWRTFTAA